MLSRSWPLAETYAILFASPLLITLLAIPLLGERIGLHRGAAIVVGLVGVLVVLQPGETELTLAHGAALAGAFFSALASVIVRKIGQDERSAVLLLYPMVANFLVMGAIMPFVYVPVEGADLAGLGLMAVLGFAATLLLIGAYRAASAVIVAPMQYSQILWAVLFGALFFDEYPTLNVLVGAGIIVLSGIYIVLREDKVEDSKSPVLRTRSRFVSGAIPRVSLLSKLWKKRRA